MALPLRKTAAAILLCLALPLGLTGCGAPGINTPAATAFAPALAATTAPSATRSAGAESTAAAMPAFTYNPAAASKFGGFKIAVPYNRSGYKSDEEFYASYRPIQASLDYICALLRDAGWNIAITIQPAVYDESGGEAARAAGLCEIMRADAALGAPPDGYIIRNIAADALVKEGLARDLSTLLPKAAPVLWGKFKPVFEKSAASLPIYLDYSMPPYPYALMLWEDAPQPDPAVKTVADFFRYAAMLGAGKIQTDIWSLLTVWAGERGYYSINGSVQCDYFASYADETCVPVPLERLPGFKEFITEYRKLLAQGKLTNMPDASDADMEGFAGYTETLSKGGIGAGVSATRRCVAYPLGVAVPDRPEDVPFTLYELVVAAGSDRAVEMMKFVEWAFIDSDNYCLLSYGKPGVDFRLDEGRLEILNGGKPFATVEEIISGAFYLRHPHFFYYKQLEPVSKLAPVNYEDAIKAYPAPAQPFMRYRKARIDGSSPLDKFADSATSAKRMELINSIAMDRNTDRTPEAFYDDVMQQFEAIREQVDDTTAAFAGAMREMME